MAIDCDSLGYLTVTLRDGKKVIIDHEATVKICMESQETGEAVHEIIRKKYYATAKVIRMEFGD
ncbi:MAG: hypothetical protein QW812_05825 [Thermoplasmataceae archaeon]